MMRLPGLKVNNFADIEFSLPDSPNIHLKEFPISIKFLSHESMNK